jgi:hypothetical protein
MYRKRDVSESVLTSFSWLSVLLRYGVLVSGADPVRTEHSAHSPFP